MKDQKPVSATAAERALWSESTRAYVERLEQSIENPILTGLQLHQNMLEVGMEGAGCQLFAESLAAMFKGGHAVNYVEAQFESRDPEIGKLVLTMQRRDGKTAHELRAEADGTVAWIGKYASGIRHLPDNRIELRFFDTADETHAVSADSFSEALAAARKVQP